MEIDNRPFPYKPAFYVLLLVLFLHAIISHGLYRDWTRRQIADAYLAGATDQKISDLSKNPPKP